MQEEQGFSKVVLFHLYPRLYTLTSGNKLTTKLRYCWPIHLAALRGVVQSPSCNWRKLSFRWLIITKLNTNEKGRPCWILHLILYIVDDKMAGPPGHPEGNLDPLHQLLHLLPPLQQQQQRHNVRDMELYLAGVGGDKKGSRILKKHRVNRKEIWQN